MQSLKRHTEYFRPLVRCLLRLSSLLGSRISNRVELPGDLPQMDSEAFRLGVLDSAKQCLPQILILDILPVASLPAMLDPALGPFSSTIDNVRRVGRNDEGFEALTGPVSEAQNSYDSPKLRPIAGLRAVFALIAVERPLLLQAASGEGWLA